MRKKEVRILVLGEDGVGKTSIILSLVSDEFANEVTKLQFFNMVPPRAEEITIPADVTPDKVPTHIVDFSTQEQSEDVLIEEIQKANVICLVYAVNDEFSIDQLGKYWLPIIRRLLGEGHGVPVILVGNKNDETIERSMEKILPLMNTFEEIETCIQCSAKNLKNLSEIFYYAQKAVLYPTSAIYSPMEKELTPKCIEALTRIFKIFDKDNDNLLNDQEVYDFQNYCFNIPLENESLDEVKSVIRKSITDGIFDNSLTLNGFLYLHKLFIQRGRHETTWSVLRKFGYDDSLNYIKSYLQPKLKIPPGCRAEISDQGKDFLKTLFDKYDEDLDDCLSPGEIKNLFSTCPNIPWASNYPYSAQANEHDWLRRDGYMAMWELTTLIEPAKCMEYLAYLGYPITDEDNQISALQITQSKRTGRTKRYAAPSVFHCHVIGSSGCGKTTFLQGIFDRTIEQITQIKESLPKYVIKQFSLYGQKKFLVLHEIGAGEVDKAGFKADCDIVCLLYDATNPRSLAFVAKAFKKHYASAPISALLVSLKNDLTSGFVDQDYELQPVQFCSRFNLHAPITASNTKNHPELYGKLLGIAAFPNLRLLHNEKSPYWLKISVGTACVTIFALVIFKFWRSK